MRGRGRGAARNRGRGGRGGRGRGRAGRVQNPPALPDIQWEQFNGPNERSPGENIPFNEVPGPSRVAMLAESLGDFFKLFIPDTLVQSWVTETNRYATQSRIVKPSTMKWSDVTFEEILAYLGMLIAMGLVNLPSISDFFSTEPILAHPWFPSILSRDRFQQINRYFHVSNETLYPNDKLAKLRPVVDNAITKFRALWTPHREISIDEQMIGTRCRVGFIQYMPAKPVKFGVKNWVLADSVYPYVCNFQIYTGRDERTPEHGLSKRVVMDLIQPYLAKGHRLYVDNFYSSPHLFKELYDQNTLACGTVRQERKGMPNELKTKNTRAYKKGDSSFMKHGSLTVMRWKDKRDVFALSTFHGNSVEDDMPKKPELITSYNQFMNGVDKNDQLLTYYSINVKSMKWWKKVFWRLLELSIVNMYQIMKFKGPITHKRLRLDLAQLLVQPLLDARTIRSGLPGLGRPAADLDRLRGKHFGTGSKKGNARGRCKVCAKQKKPNGKCRDTKTANYCERCEVFLCEGNCFKIYHTQQNF